MVVLFPKREDKEIKINIFLISSMESRLEQEIFNYLKNNPEDKYVKEMLNFTKNLEEYLSLNSYIKRTDRNTNLWLGKGSKKIEDDKILKILRYPAKKIQEIINPETAKKEYKDTYLSVLNQLNKKDIQLIELIKEINYYIIEEKTLENNPEKVIENIKKFNKIYQQGKKLEKIIQKEDSQQNTIIKKETPQYILNHTEYVKNASLVLGGAVILAVLFKVIKKYLNN